jgi:hypothetical protein
MKPAVVVHMAHLKALLMSGERLENYVDLLAVARAEAKRLLKTHENTNVKDISYSAKCRMHIAFLEVPDN